MAACDRSLSSSHMESKDIVYMPESVKVQQLLA